MSARNASVVLLALLMVACFSDGSSSVFAQRRGFQIGGPNGVVGGGGMGLRIGGQNGVQFGGGQGARFGPAGRGFQVGGGQGVQIGGLNGAPPNGYNTPQYYPSAQLNPAAAINGTNPAVNSTGYVPNPNRNQLAATSPRPAAPLPGGSLTSPVSTASPSPAPSQIILELSSDAKRPIDYTINGTQFQLAPGNSVRMQSGQSWKVGIDRKPGQSQEYDLQTPGLYRINKTESGWVIDSPNSAKVAETEIAPPPIPQPAMTQPPPAEPLTQAPAEPLTRVAQKPEVVPTQQPKVASSPPPQAAQPTTAAPNDSPPKVARPKAEPAKVAPPKVEPPKVEPPTPDPVVGPPKSVLEFNKDK